MLEIPVQFRNHFFLGRQRRQQRYPNRQMDLDKREVNGQTGQPGQLAYIPYAQTDRLTEGRPAQISTFIGSRRHNTPLRQTGASRGEKQIRDPDQLFPRKNINIDRAGISRRQINVLVWIQKSKTISNWITCRGQDNCFHRKKWPGFLAS